MRRQLERLVLLTIAACDGRPMPESALTSAVCGLGRHLNPTLADVEEALRQAEVDGFVSGASEALMERSWTLTTAGIHKARQLR